jgi:thiamine pyrophosphokinase
MEPDNGKRAASARCVIVGGADIKCFDRIKTYIREDDYIIACDSGLKHIEQLEITPSLIVGDFDSHENPHSDIETIVLPVAKDDTDTVYAEREGLRRGYEEFLLLGVFGGRMDHTLANVYQMFDLESKGCTVLAADDYSEFTVISEGGTARVSDRYPFFSLLNMTGTARGISIKGAKYTLDGAEITSGYQYAVSNEVLPGQTAEITIKEGRLLLIMDL